VSTLLAGPAGALGFSGALAAALSEALNTYNPPFRWPPARATTPRTALFEVAPRGSRGYTHRVQDPDRDLEQIEQAIGYRFADRRLLLDALTHCSYSNENLERAPEDNDRLEFMGDAVLELGISTLLWNRFPGATAGELTRRRADLVCEEGLADIARSLGLGEAMRLGRGEERTGGRNKPRLLASALEACMAAVYLDGGQQAALQVCRALFDNRLDELPPGVRDYKSRVQELLQRRGKRPPAYEVQSCTGPDHERQFEVAALVNDEPPALGRGRSKAEAEQEAARALLEQLEGGPTAG
jgi:ribonuclease-3